MTVVQMWVTPVASSIAIRPDAHLISTTSFWRRDDDHPEWETVSDYLDRTKRYLDEVQP